MALKEDDDQEVKPVEGEGEQGEVIALEDAPASKAAEPDERVHQADDEDEGSSATDAEREARRLERRARKQREKAARERNQRELAFLRDRNEQLERKFSAWEQRQTQSESAIIGNRLNEVDRYIREAEQVHAIAINEGKGDDATEAMRIRDQLMQERGRLNQARDALKGRAEQPEVAAPQQQQVQRPAAPAREEFNEEVVSLANDWVKKNAWYKVDRSDEESAIVGAIDDRLVQEGFDPETEEYWSELTTRVQRRLPHKFQKQAAAPATNGAQQRGPAMANGGRGDRAVRPGEIYVSPERKAAMIDAGVWDDPKLRVKFLKRYQQYDSEHGASSRH